MKTFSFTGLEKSPMPKTDNNLPWRLMLPVILVFLGTAFASDANHAGKPFRDKRQHGLSPGVRMGIALKSKVDGTIGPLLLKIPDAYTDEKAWPLLVTLHGLGSGPILAPGIDSMIQIGPYGRDPAWAGDAAKQDVFDAIEFIRKLLNIDEDRIYLCGFSMGAITTFDLGLRYPDRWAACVPVCGRCDNLELIENARYLPFWIHAGGLDMILSSDHSRTAYDKARKLGFSHWKYSEHAQMAHTFQIDFEQVEKWLLTKSRVKNPASVSFCTKDIAANRAYWVAITEYDEHADKAQINAAVSGQEINVKLENITNYTLTLNQDLLNCRKQVRILENGTLIFHGLLNPNGSFVRQTGTKNVVGNSQDLEN
jgi:predicted esterase